MLAVGKVALWGVWYGSAPACPAQCFESPRFFVTAEVQGHVPSAHIAVALLADGSTTKRGHDREQLWACVRALYAMQDVRGRFALSADPDWLLHHAMATFAVLEAARLSPSRRVLQLAQPAVRVLLERLAHGVDTDVEVLLWSHWIARSAARADATRELATGLAVEVRRRFAAGDVRVPGDHRERCAAAALACCLGGPWQAEWRRLAAKAAASPLAEAYLAAAVACAYGMRVPWPEFARPLGRSISAQADGVLQEPDPLRRAHILLASSFYFRHCKLVCASVAAARPRRKN